MKNYADFSWDWRVYLVKLILIFLLVTLLLPANIPIVKAESDNSTSDNQVISENITFESGSDNISDNETPQSNNVTQEEPSASDNITIEEPPASDNNTTEEPAVSDNTTSEEPAISDNTTPEEPSLSDNTTEEEPAETPEEPSITDNTTEEEPAVSDNTTPEEPPASDNVTPELENTDNITPDLSSKVIEPDKEDYLVSPNGKIKLDIPLGAVTEATKVEIKEKVKPNSTGKIMLNLFELNASPPDASREGKEDTVTETPIPSNDIIPETPILNGNATPEIPILVDNIIPETQIQSEELIFEQDFASDNITTEETKPHKKVFSFEKELTLTVRHTPEELSGLDLDSLHLYYLDEESRQWVLVPSIFDRETLVLTATLTHFSNYGELGNTLISGPGKVMAAQVNIHSGTATYSYPLELPPGPGGFKPSLALIYNSGSVDEMKNKRSMGSWVGIGWTLHVGRISCDPITNEYTLDLNGGSYKLFSSDNTNFKTDPEQYYKITRANITTWHMYDKEGVYYKFGGTDNSSQYTYDTSTKYYRWDLSQIEDTNGNTANITYAQQITTVSSNNNVRSAYPTSITYGNATVHFILDNVNSYGNDGFMRADNPRSYGSNDAPKVMETRSLDSIEVKVDGSLICKYVFNYITTDCTYSSEYSGIFYSGKHILSKITQYGADGSSYLPETTFSYEDKQVYRKSSDTEYSGNPGNPASLTWPFLTLINNGYGGLICFSYTQIPNTSILNTWTRQAVTSKKIYDSVSGNDTQSMTFYPDAHPESTSVDGYVMHAQNTTWSTLVYGAGTSAGVSDGGISAWRAAAGSGYGNWGYIDRSVLLFDTSSLPDTANITSATLSVRGYDKQNAFTSTSPVLQLYSFSPDSSTNLTAGDYDTFGSSPYTNSGITYNNFSTTGYNNFILNDTGLAAIQRTGISKFGFREATCDTANVTPSPWVNSYIRFEIYASDAGVGYKPKLEVTYANGSLTPSETYTFEYNGNPQYNGTGWDQEFRGWNIIKQTDSAGNYEEHYFYTTGTIEGKNAEILTGREYKTEWYDISNTLLKTKTYDWSWNSVEDSTLTIRPNAAGDITQLLYYPSAPNYACVDDTGDGDGDSTKVNAIPYLWHRDLYQLSDIMEAGVITNVTIYIRHKRVDQVSYYLSSGGRTCIKTNGSEYYGSFVDPGTTSYILSYTDYSTNPQTGKGWTFDEIKSLQAGYSGYYYLSPDNFWSYGVCTQVYVEVDFSRYEIHLDKVEEITGSKTSRIRYEYDGYGNIETEYLDGDTSTSDDNAAIHREYNYNEDLNILSKVAGEWVTDYQGNTKKAIYYYFDNHGYYTPPSKGNVTRSEEWENATPTTINTYFSYDDRGNMVTSTDASGNTTSWTYPYPYIYASKKTLPNGFYEEYTYEPGTTNLKTITDINGQITEYKYDEHKRLIKAIKPCDSEDSPSIEYIYNNWGDIGQQNIEIRSKTSDDKYLWQKDYFDGLGRVIQTQTPGDTDNETIIASTTSYNHRGLVEKQYTAFASPNISSYVPPMFKEWKKRVEITIDHTKFQSDLTHFPILIHLSPSCGQSGDNLTQVFDEVGGNYKQIAVTTSDGQTQLFVEVEKWDATNKEAWLWVSKIGWTISSTSDTTLYLYFDSGHADNSDYVGDADSNPGKNVWDSGYVLVDHMRDISANTTIDSTVNANNGTKSNQGAPNETSGLIGYSQSFDASSEYINYGAGAARPGGGPATLEAIFYKDMDASEKGTYAHIFTNFYEHPGSNLWFHNYTNDVHYATASKNTWHYMGLKYYGDTSTAQLFIDTVKYGCTWQTGSHSISSNGHFLGNFSGDPAYNFPGDICEYRVSSIERSDAWLKATYYTCWDNLVSFSEPETSNPVAKCTSYSYDALGRVTSQTKADSTIISHDYSVTWRDTVTDANNHQKRYYYDAFNRLWKIEEMSNSTTVNATTQYFYDVLGNLTQVKDNNNNTTNMTYNWLSRKLTMDDPDMGHWSYGYDIHGNLTTQTDAKNQTISMTYDKLNRLTGKRYISSNTANVTYSYDDTTNGNYGKGLRTQMSDGVGNTNYKYDARGRLIEETRILPGAGTFTTRFGYDSADRLAWVQYPTGENVTQTYSQRGLPYKLSGSAGDLVSSTLYNALGMPTQINLGNTLKTTYSYWGLDYTDYGTQSYGRLYEIKTWPQAGGTVLQDVLHTWDAGGNLSNRYDALSSFSENFTYDFMDRLKTVSGSYTDNWDYNEIGNIVSHNGTSYAYNGYGPHAASHVGAASYTYDANGNMSTRGSQSITWDVENRPVAVSGGATANFTYDGDGNRVKKIEGGQTILYINKYFEINLSTSTNTSYYYHGGTLVALKENTTLKYIHQDHLSGTSLVTSNSGTLIESIKYYAFGATRSLTGTDVTDKKFTGQRLDGTGLYYFNARYYDPTIGRFISPDTIVPNPANPQSLNRYSYCVNNPLKYTDPDGHGPGDDYMRLVDLGRRTSENQQVTDIVNSLPPGSIPDDVRESVEKQREDLQKEVKDIYDKYYDATIPITLLGLASKLVYKGSIILPSGVIVTDKIFKQLFPRGWTLQGIDDAFLNPYYTCESTNLDNGNPARAYYRSNISGDYVVIDTKTMKTVQIGRCYDPYWIPNPSMRNPIWGYNYQLPPGYYGPDMYGRWPL